MASSQMVEDIAAIVRTLDSWLTGVEFQPPPNKKTAKCVESEEDQREKLDQLFRALGVYEQVDQGTILFGIYQYPSSGASRWNPGAGGWAKVVPLKFLDELPTALGRQLAIGEVISINETVECTGAVICLVLTPRVRSESSNSKKKNKSGSKSK